MCAYLCECTYTHAKFKIFGGRGVSGVTPPSPLTTPKATSLPAFTLDLGQRALHSSSFEKSPYTQDVGVQVHYAAAYSSMLFLGQYGELTNYLYRAISISGMYSLTNEFNY